MIYQLKKLLLLGRPFFCNPNIHPMRSYFTHHLEFWQLQYQLTRRQTVRIFSFKKALAEKQAGRRLEVWKNLEKAISIILTIKRSLQNLLMSYMSLDKYAQAREMYQKLEQMGDNSPALYKQLLNLSFNTKQI